MKKHIWTEADDIVALYCCKYGERSDCPTLQEISRNRGMSVASLRMRIKNFKAIESGVGLSHFARQSETVYHRFGKLAESDLRNLAFDLHGGENEILDF